MAEKRSSGHSSTRARAVDAGTPTASPTTTPPSSPRSGRRRSDVGPGLSPRTLAKPLLASVYVYVTVAALAWELWRRRTTASDEASDEASAPAAPDEGPAAASTGNSPQVARGASQQVARGESTPHGRPLTLDGEFLHTSCEWSDPGIQGIVGDQRHREALGLLPRRLLSGSTDLGWRELFELVLHDGQRVQARDCSLKWRSALTEQSGLERAALLGGEVLSLRCPSKVEVEWSAALLRTLAGAEVLRTGVTFRSASRGAPPAVAQLRLWVLNAEIACPAGPNASQGALPPTLGQRAGSSAALGRCFQLGGSVDGSPLASLQLGAWLAAEHPRGVTSVQNGTLEVALSDPLPDTAYFASLGSVGPLVEASRAEDALPLLRRHFHSYLGIVRASTPKPHLHYATWYDLRRAPCTDSSELGKPFCGEAQTLNEQKAMDRLLTIHLELLQRGVPLDGLLLDDGWDDADLPWRVHSRNFPVGLSALSAAAAARGTGVGAWLSPWGGFGEGGKRRLRAGLAKGFESYEGHPNMLRLSGARYYDWFRNATRSLVLQSGLSFLKFDGVGAGGVATGAGRFSADVDWLLNIVTELRAEAPRLRLSVSTGSWPSPFWLQTVDAVWRGGPDLGREGAGSPPQQWITFRDAMVHQWVVRRAPLFPLSSLTLGGVVWSKAEEPGAYLRSYSLDDFACEVWSFFFAGTSWQELLVQPALLSPVHWDILANVANLSRHHSATLRDAHWAGGDPAAGEVYGYASYACPPCQGLLSWRNPKAESQNLTFTLREALSLPRAWPGGAVAGRWRVRALWPVPAAAAPAGVAAATVAPAGSEMPMVDAWAQRPAPSWEHVGLDEALRLELAGLELRVLEALPLRP